MDSTQKLQLAQVHNPVEASERALAVGVLAADFVAAANALASALLAEAEALRTSGAQASDPQVVAISRDFAYIDALIQATTKATTSTWVNIHSR